MSDREISRDTTDNAAKKQANYTLELEVSEGIDKPFIKIEKCIGWKLQSGFLVIFCEGGERWYQAKNILSIVKS